MLPAQADRDLRAPSARLVEAQAHKAPDAYTIEMLEGICGDHLIPEIRAEEADFRVVAGRGQSELRQIVAADREEVGVPGEIGSVERDPQHLNQAADGGWAGLSAGCLPGKDVLNDLPDSPELLAEADHRHQDPDVRAQTPLRDRPAGPREGLPTWGGFSTGCENVFEAAEPHPGGAQLLDRAKVQW